MFYFNHFLTPAILLILPTIVVIVGFKFYVINPSRRTECGLFSIWVETETINDNQKKVVTKYSLYKWCFLKVVKHETDKDYYNSL